MLWSMLSPNGSFLVLPRKVKQNDTNEKVPCNGLINAMPSAVNAQARNQYQGSEP